MKRLIRIAAVGALASAIMATALATAGGAGAASFSTRRANHEAAIPAGTVLRVGEQLKNLSTVLTLGHQNQNFPYQVQYSEFVGGPPMLQAFEGGSLDVGFIQSTPLIFAQAAGQHVTAVAGWATSGSAYALVAAPGQHSITSWAGLKGKRVAVQEGTALESALLEGLHSAGLSLRDITPVNLPTTQIAAALQGGSADAAIEVEPLLSAYLHANPSAQVIEHPAAVTEKSEFIVATSSALADKGVSAALADYITRLIKAYQYLAVHPQGVIQTIYEGEYGLTPARAAYVASLVGPSKFFPLPGGLLAPQQNLANLYLAAGSIPAHISVTKEFDPRFNALVASEQAS
ncbi:MAG TPA: ABC transporter substrate-binding protein [Acidimicrobiales bacterium]|jgi:sulfonate transport system substrate-binding protein|nr:ABC transporter substrate-binding protein [Acidimicrobiales bacterium]